MFNSKVFKKSIAYLMLSAMCVSAVPVSGVGAVTVQAATASPQMESLGRGLVAVKTDSGVFLSWRLLGTEDYSTTFNVYRDGVKIASNVSDSTNYLDKKGSGSSTYFVRSVVGGKEVTESDIVAPWGNNYKDVPIDKPANTTLNGETVTYSANDATVADVDGDGEYEIILKWDPSNSKDNSQSGYTSNVYVDCYEMDGSRRWRIDLGKNIRAGAHYTQFIAYDLNGDGKAEVAMKTADGTIDGQGNVIGDASKDYRNSSGYVLSGPEYLTLFDGRTGKALTTIDYEPGRGTVSSWGDKYGNRVDRFLAGVAYFDGKTPSLLVCRGYYTRAVLVAYEYKGGKLNKEWTFDSNSSGNSAYAGEGNHNLSIADVDNDGKDEVVYGSCVIDHDGKGLYATGHGHGDALHVGDFDPDRSGLEIYQVHEEKSSSIESVQMRDAKTGKTIWGKKLSVDCGRGLLVNIGPDYYPYVALSSKGAFDKKGNQITSNVTKFGINFASYWDGDLYREVLDKTYINKWDWNSKNVVRVLTGENVHSNNGTKSTPSLSGDILGDWREEVIWPTSDDKALRIYTTTDVTNAKLYTLMHDSQYRTAIAWQNVAYNQPPHTSYYIGPEMDTPKKPSIYTVGSYTLKTPSSSSTEVATTAVPTTAPTQATTVATVAPTTAAPTTAAPTEAPTQAPTSGTVSGVAHTGSVTIKGANWWASKDISKSDLLGDVNPADVTAIKFTGTTPFWVGYNSKSGYVQPSGEIEYTLTDVALDNYYLQVCLSKNDNVNYTFKWEVYTNSQSQETPTQAPTTVAPTTVAPTTQAPTQAPTTAAPTETPTTSADSGNEASYVHNFTTDGTNSSFLTFSSKKNLSSSKGSFTYDGLKLTKCLKVESSTSVSFTTTKPNAKLIMVVQSKSSGALKVTGAESFKISNLTSDVELREIALGSAGTYTISKSTAENYIYYIKIVE